MPAGLQSAHSTKSGAWGLLHVLEGEVLYQLKPLYQGERRAGAGETIVIEAEVPITSPSFRRGESTSNSTGRRQGRRLPEIYRRFNIICRRDVGRSRSSRK
ncbi:DUF1971 domain-containing protein [Rhodopseudomonas pseudopalustris]|uniref:DUF1971 domain-containing protein n=1 Tax=Rhodopseudomonas pseudopalustris TaxID=1513892 RepID=UPI001FCE23FE|nr:DUF1971 domain-containing protein [Rhodopseudomonas pseudopalustris]